MYTHKVHLLSHIVTSSSISNDNFNQLSSLFPQLCYNDGVETVVLPKTSEAKDGAWYGLMKYAWSG